MNSERRSQEIQFEQLLEELGLSDDGVPGADAYFLSQIEFDQSDLSGEPLRYERIVDQSQRWIAFLQSQADALTAIVSGLYDRLAATCDLTVLDVGRAHTDVDLKARVIDRLEWTLIALESWIEEQMPSAADARFRIRWSDGDGVASWVVAKQDANALRPLTEIVRDGAETEGEFPSDIADAVAALVVAGVREGEVQLPRLRRLDAESNPGESLFALVPRGEAYRASVAMAADSGTLLPAELEAQLNREETRQLATLLDEASYSAVQAEAASMRREPRFSHDIVDSIIQLSERCHIPSPEMARCLMTLVEGRLDSALRARDVVGSVRLAKAVGALTRVVLERP